MTDSMLEAVEALRGEDFRSEAAQVRAKSVLQQVADEVPSYRWSYIAPRIIRNVTGALLDLEFLGSERPGELEQYETDARQIAQVWESLSNLGERTTRVTALTNAAAAYELAGYQANAACIAKSIPELIEERTSLPLIGALFLQRRLLALVEIVRAALSHEPGASQVSEELLYRTAEAVASDGLSRAARYFLSGRQDLLREAEDLLGRAQGVFADVGAVSEFNLTHMLRTLLPVLKDRSLWQVLGPTVPNNPRWQRYLKLLARGLGDDLLESSSITELWPSQLTALRQGLLSANESKLVRMPTSAGKTRVAELSIAHAVVSEPGLRCIYVAPYRALVGEVEQTLLSVFADMGLSVSSIAGTYESDDFETLLVSSADILVLTPEKLDLLLRLHPELLESVGLYVVDEGQLLDEGERGVKLELLLSRLRRRFPSTRFLILSAVIPDETLQDFASWFRLSDGDVITSTWRPTIQRVAKFEWQGASGKLVYSPDEDVQLLRAFVPGVIRQRTFEHIAPDTGRRRRPRFPAPSKGETAAELAVKFAELGQALVFCSQPNFVESVGKAITRRLELSRLVDEDIPSHFETPRTRAAITAASWLGDDHPITELLRQGIGIHHGKLPEAVRKAVERDFRERRYRVVVATNTLAQGVNLPIQTVIIHSCWRSVESPTGEYVRERISARDYWNIAGRAGRAKEETEGTIIHITLSRTDEEDYAYYLGRRNAVEPVQGALFNLLLDLVAGRLTEAGLAQELDSDVLALLVEESRESVDEEWINSILSGTLAEIEVGKSSLQIGPLAGAFLTSGENILTTVPDPNRRRVYSTTGLSSSSCERLRESVRAHGEEILRTAQDGDGVRLAALVLDSCGDLGELEPDYVFDGDTGELLAAWVAGNEMSSIRERYRDQAESSESLARFIEDLFGYRLPWGASAWVRIFSDEFEVEEANLPAIIRFLPAMIKYGVPTPESAWAMSVGIPLRSLAIAIGADFVREAPSPSYETFLTWLGRLDSLDLRERYGLTSPLLEDVTRALYRAGRNEYLEDPDLDHRLPITCDVRGMSYENRASVAVRVQEGDRLSLVRDYDNPVDRNAIAVYWRNDQLGFVPREIAQLLAPELDTGTMLGGQAVRVAPGRPPRIEASISRA
jgi:helicase